MTTQSPATSLHFTPLLEAQYLWPVLGIGATLLALSLLRYRRGAALRGLTFTAFVLVLANPSILQQDRHPVKDVAVIVVDKSASQSFGQRAQRAQRALASLKSQLEHNDALDVRIIDAPEEDSLARDTKLFGALDTAFANVPQKQRAGVIFLTDGQIHDAPTVESTQNYGPVHSLLTGERNEKDRQVVIVSAPAYGLIGQEISIKYRIEDTSTIGQDTADVTLTTHDGERQTFTVPVNTDQVINVAIDNPAQNVFTLSTGEIQGEITTANNTAPILINGVRDRMKVLLVSGKPHAGERTWRDLLTSDPGVDLVHFTILREPSKVDYTPQNELSLIAFPFRELFEVKLYDFDLIIFDQYRVNDILPEHYFQNIVRYINEGGAFLEASGPEFAGKESIYDTPLGDILPASPTEMVIEKPFKPALNALGAAHPVTRSLVWNNTPATLGAAPPWGQWLHQVEIKPRRGDVLMTGADEQPLLVLDRVGKGRVAQLASDQVWLWSRGYDGGGPHAEFLRRLVHWLMKEPELDERALDIRIDRNTITLRKQNLENKQSETLALTTPDGTLSTLDLKPDGKGSLTHKMTVDKLGIYAFEDIYSARRYAIVGDLNPPELRGVVTTDKILKPLISSSGGGVIWLEKTPEPTVRLVSSSHNLAGGNWIGLRRNNDFTVAGVKDITLLPEWLSLLALLCLGIVTWWSEGRQK